MRRWIFSWPGILAVVGLISVILAVAQHGVGVLGVPHLAIYLGVVGIALLFVGIFIGILRRA
jgi:hypothetical protein